MFCDRPDAVDRNSGSIVQNNAQIVQNASIEVEKLFTSKAIYRNATKVKTEK